MKWKTLLFCVVGAVMAGCVKAAVDDVSVAALTDLLDRAICEHGQYAGIRERRIAEWKQRLVETDSSSIDFFRWNRELYKEYKAYLCDSAIHYLNSNLRWAERRSLQESADEIRLESAFLMASIGLYQEAFELLGQVRRATLSVRLLSEYYRCYHHLYAESGTYTQDVFFRRQYQRLAMCYEDSLMQVLPPASSLYREHEEIRAAAAGRLDEAFRINDVRLANTRPDTPEYALVTYHRSRLYRQMENREEEKRYLILSALTDIRLAITDHASLWTLAELFYEEGDIGRAYRYIRFSWDETNRYNARSRSLQTAGILSLIDLTYQAMQAKQSERLRIYLLLISVLALLLIVAVCYIYRQMRRLSAARNRLEQSYEQLEISNQIKEEYIGRFLNLCSGYINRLDAYRRMVNKKISSGQTEELLKMVRSRNTQDADLKELYENFDTAFLHIFPDFVEKFNDLLQPEERIVLRKGELLNTELRIFALIRLGVDDSSKIAEFLRYSVNTIYNYRARVKNKARISREEFENHLMMIR